METMEDSVIKGETMEDANDSRTVPLTRWYCSLAAYNKWYFKCY